MPRLHRHRLGEGIYHVFNRGLDRRRVFRDDADRDYFVRLLRRYRERFPVRLLHWVVMGNHYHLLVECPSGGMLSSLLSGLQRAYTAYHHACRTAAGEKVCGPLWQGRFRSPLVQSGSYLLACGRYIERNPLRAGREPLPWDYAWSSARAYALGCKDGVTDVEGHPLYRGLGRNGTERRAVWQGFLLQSRNAAREEPLFRSAGRSVGDEEFLARLLVRRGRVTSLHRGRKRNNRKARTTGPGRH